MTKGCKLIILKLIDSQACQKFRSGYYSDNKKK